MRWQEAQDSQPCHNILGCILTTSPCLRAHISRFDLFLQAASQSGGWAGRPLCGRLEELTCSCAGPGVLAIVSRIFVNLHSLTLRCPECLTAAMLQQLARGLPRLRRFAVSGCFRVQEDALEQLQAWRGLTTLEVRPGFFEGMIDGGSRGRVGSGAMSFCLIV